MSSPVRLVYVTNPIDPAAEGGRECIEYPYVTECFVHDFIPADWTAKAVTVEQNGHPVALDKWRSTKVDSGDMLVITRYYGFFGTAAAVAAGSALIGVGTGTGAFLLALGLNLIATTLISGGLSFLAQKLISRPGDPLSLPSPTYGAGGISTTVASGTPIPVVYGKHKIGGALIASTTGHVAGVTRNTTNYNARTSGLTTRLDFALCEGPVRSIDGQIVEMDRHSFNSYGNPSSTVYNGLRNSASGTIGIQDVTRTKVAGYFLNTQVESAINRVRVSLKKFGTIAAGSKVTMSLQGDDSQKPNGIDVFTPIEVDVSDIFASATLIDFVFPTALLKPTALPFWIVFDADYTASATNYIGIEYFSVSNPNWGWTKYLAGTWQPFSGLLLMDVEGASTPYTGTTTNVNGNPLAASSSFGETSSRDGRRWQRPLPGQDDLIFEKDVGQVMVVGTSYTSTTTNVVTGATLVFIYTGGMYRVNSSNRLDPLNVLIDIRYRPDGVTTGWTGSFQLNETPPIILTTDGMAVTIPLPQSMQNQKVEFECTLRAPVVTASSTIEWRSIRELGASNFQFRHPHIALLQIIREVATSVGPFEKMTTVVEGKLVWDYDGTDWNYIYQRNPSAVALDWALNERYGGGDTLTLDNIDLASFTLWRTYCDELISDGKGGAMARHTFDGVFDNPGESWWDALQRIAGCGRCKIIWTGSVLRCVVDAASIGGTPIDDPVHFFSDGNAADFTLSFLGTKGRANRMVVEFLDEELDWAKNERGWPDESLRSGNVELIEETASRWGITNAVRAENEAKYLVDLNNIVWEGSLTGTISSVRVEEGDIIEIGSSLFPWGQVAGQVYEDAAGVNAVKLDRRLVLGAGTYKIKVTVVDTGDGEEYIEERTVDETSGTYEAGTFIDITPSWLAARKPKKGDPWSVGLVGADGQGPARKAKVTSIKLTQDHRKQVNFVQSITHSDRVSRNSRPAKMKRADGYTIPPKPINFVLSPTYEQGRGATVTASWSRVAWPYQYTFSVYVRQDGAGDRYQLYSVTGDESITFVGLRQGTSWDVAICPNAPATGQHHNPGSKFVARAGVVLHRVGITPITPVSPRF